MDSCRACVFIVATLSGLLSGLGCSSEHLKEEADATPPTDAGAACTPCVYGSECLLPFDGIQGSRRVQLDVRSEADPREPDEPRVWNDFGASFFWFLVVDDEGSVYDVVGFGFPLVSSTLRLSEGSQGTLDRVFPRKPLRVWVSTGSYGATRGGVWFDLGQDDLEAELIVGEDTPVRVDGTIDWVDDTEMPSVSSVRFVPTGYRWAGQADYPIETSEDGTFSTRILPGRYDLWVARERQLCLVNALCLGRLRPMHRTWSGHPAEFRLVREGLEIVADTSVEIDVDWEAATRLEETELKPVEAFADLTGDDRDAQGRYAFRLDTELRLGPHDIWLVSEHGQRFDTTHERMLREMAPIKSLASRAEYYRHDAPTGQYDVKLQLAGADAVVDVGCLEVIDSALSPEPTP